MFDLVEHILQEHRHQELKFQGGKTVNSSHRNWRFPQIKRQILHLILGGFIFLGGLAFIHIAPADAGTLIRTGDTNSGAMALGYPHQRRIVRDASGYWYAVWTEQDGTGSTYDVLFTRSNDTEGTSWATPVKIAGNGGIVYSGYDCRHPAMDIDRTNGKIHLIFVDVGSPGYSSNSLYYTKLNDLNNWNVATGWTQIQGGVTPRYNVVDYYSYASGDPVEGPSIAVDSSGNAHVAYLGDPAGGGGSWDWYPYYAYGNTSSGWAAPIKVSVFTQSTYSRFSTVEVTSGGYVHVFWNEYTGSAWEYVYNRYTTDFMNFYPSYDNTVVYIGGHNLSYLSAAADGEGRIYLNCLDTSDSDICGAYSTNNGTSWTERENIDILGWSMPAVGVRLDSGITTDLIISPDVGTDPDLIWYWKGGDPWSAAEVSTGESTDQSAVSLEKKVGAQAPSYGFLYYDYISTSSSGIYLGQVYLVDLVLASHSSGQVTDQIGAVNSVNDANLFRFALKNTTASAITVDQIVFHLSGVVGITNADLSDLRINDGTSDVTTGGAPSITGTTGTITFTGNFSIPASSTVNYTLIGDVTTPVGGDRMTIALNLADITLVSGTKGGFPPSTVTHYRDYPYSFPVTAGDDDSYSTSSADNASAVRSYTYLRVIRSSTSTTRTNMGVRFQNVTIPQGSIINRAEFRGYVYDANYNDVHCYIFGHLTNGSQDFATNTYIQNTTYRPRTTAYTTWQQLDMPVGWQDVDVTSVVQELVNQGTWDAGNKAATLLFIADSTSGNQYAYFRSYNYGSLIPVLNVDYTLPNTVIIGDHSGGQATDAFDGNLSKNDVDLYKFSLFNTSGSAVTVDQIIFNLSSVAGIVSGDLSDLRIYDGTSDVVTGGVPSITDDTGTITFATDWQIPANSTVQYTLRGDAANLIKDDTLTISLVPAGITLALGDVGGSVSFAATHTADYAATLGEHGSGQLSDQLDGTPTQNDRNLFRFRLVNNGSADLTVDQVVLLLSSVSGIVTGDLTDLRINNGTIDVSTGGVPSIAAGSGTITFDANFTLPASSTVDYTVIGDITNVVNADTMTLALGAANVTLAAGVVGGSAPTNVTHTGDHAATLGEHASGQLTDQFDGAPSKDNVNLFRFQLVNTTAVNLTVDQVQFQLSSVTGIVSSDLSDLRINNGTSDVSTGGVPSIAAGSGTITFSGGFILPASSTVNYTLIGDASNLAVGDTLTIALGTANVTLQAGSLGGVAPINVTHTVNWPQVSASNDDAHVVEGTDNATSYLASTQVQMVFATTPSSRQHGGFRIPGIYIPPGATINSATLNVYVGDTYDDPRLDVYGHLTLDAPDFATNTQIYGRPRTTATVAWAADNVGFGWKTVNVTTILQELVDQPGWSSGNAVAFLFIARSFSGYRCYFHAWDYNAGHTDAAYLTFDYTPPTTLILGNHASGQITDQFDGGVTQNDKDLYRFQIVNTTGSVVTVDQIVFNLSAISGIETTDLSDLRINDGTSDVVTGGTPSITDTTGTITFTADWNIPAGATKNYTLRGDAANLVKDDTLTIALSASGITLVSGDVGGSVSATATHTTDNTVLLAEHGSGQLSDQLDGRSPHDDANLFRFQLTNNSTADVTVNSVAFQLSSVNGIADTDFSDVRLFDGTNPQGGTPVVSIASGTGTITFSTPFTLPASQTVSYTLIGDLTNLVNGDTLTIALGTGNITLAAGTIAGTPPTNVTHTADHALLLAAHDSGQVTDQWDSSTPQVDRELYWFKLSNNTAGTITINQLIFRLTSVAGILSGELTNLEIVPEGGGTVGGAGLASINGSTGTITFSTPFDLTSGQAVNYKVIGDASNLYNGDTITLGLVTGDITLAGGSVGGSNPATATHTTNGPTVQTQITDTNDDVYERGSTIWNLTYPVRNSIDSTGNRMPGLRFPGIAVPQGVTINSATVEGYVYDTGLGDDLYANVYGHAIDNAPNWVDLPDVDGRPRTTASTTVAQDNLGLGWHGVDVTAIVQEIVNRAGWASGNAMAFMFIPPPPGTTTHCYFHSVDTNATYAARLTIEYQLPVTLVLGDYSPGGQVTDQFDGSTSQNDKELFRFQLANPTGNDLTVDQIVFQLSSITGIVDTDLSDLRIYDGATNVGGTASVSIAGATGTITFGDNFTVPAGQTKNYALIGDVANLVGLDSITLSLGTGDITLVTGSVSGTAPANATHTAEYTVMLGSHASGQVSDQFDGSLTQNDRNLFRFQFVNNTQGTVTVSQVVFQLTAVSGIASGDLSDLRINDGTSDVSTGGVPSIAGGTGTITFSNDFTIGAGATVNYTLIGDAANLANGDTLTIGLGTANVTLADGSVGGTPPTSATHTVEHTVLLSEHASGQITDQFDGALSQSDATLFRLQIVNNSNATVTVTQVQIQLSSVSGIASGDLSDLRINDGTSDVSTGGVASIVGATGTITFDGDFNIDASATVNYSVIGDVSALANGDTVTLALGTANVSLLAGSVGGTAPTNVTHTADHTALMSEHPSGQVTDALFTEDSKTNASLFRFQLQNNTTGDLTVSQVQFQLSQVNGIVTGDLTTLRLNNGTSDVGGSGTPSISGGGGTGTGTITFSTSFTLPASSTVQYTLYGDLANLEALDKMTVALGTPNVTLSVGTVGGTAPSSVTHFRDQPAIDREIIDTADDAWEDQNDAPTEDVTSTTSSNLIVQTHTTGTSRRHSGFRFQDITIQKNATINRAVLQVYLPSRANSSLYADVYGDNTANAANFTTTPDINGSNNTVTRELTTATTPLEIGQWGAGWRNIEVTSIIQEIVNRDDWASGNALALLVIGRSNYQYNPTGWIEDYSAAETNHARLSVDFNNVALLGTHAWGQVVDQFDAKASEQDQTLFRFRLYNLTGSALNVNSVIFRLTGVNGIASGDLTDLRINNGTSDVSTGGVALIAGDTGTITFSSGFTIAAYSFVDYLLLADTANMASGDELTISLDTADISVQQGPVGRHIPLPTSVTHSYGARQVMISYSESGSSPWTMYFTTHQTGSGYQVPGSPALSGRTLALHWKVVNTSPDQSKQSVVFMQHNPGSRDEIYASIYDGTNWDDGNGSPYGDAYYLDRAGDDGVKNVRNFDAAYEQNSQRLLVVRSYGPTVNTFHTYRYDGSWTAYPSESFPSFIGYPTVGVQDWMRLSPMPGTNRIAMIALSNQYDGTLYGWAQGGIWDGDTGIWSLGSLYSPDVQVYNPTEAMDVAFVLGGTNAGEAIFVWGNGRYLRWARWNPSTGWHSSYLLADLGAGNLARWMRLKCKPAGDNMVLAVGDNNRQLVTFTYDGDTRTWSSSSPYHTTSLSGDPAANRPFDLTWDIQSGLGTNNVLLVYSDSSGVNYSFSSSGGSGFNSPIQIDATQAYWIQVERAPNPVPHLVYSDADNDLQAYTWNGVSWDSAGTDISTNLEVASTNDVQPFGLATAPLLGGPITPTLIKLASFTAEGEGDQVRLEWVTKTEIDNVGFNLYRSTERGGTYQKLNSSLIPGLISSAAGKRYVFMDSGVTRGRFYYYKLEDIDLSGTRTMHGPLCVDWDGDGIPDDQDAAVGDSASESGEADASSSDSGSSDEEGGSGSGIWGSGGWPVTRVKLRSFRAEETEKGVLIEWQTGHEVNNLGFHVYREESGELYRLTPDLIAGSAMLAGSGIALGAGYSYQWLDISSSPLATGDSRLASVRYWLEDIDLSGKRTMHGPVSLGSSWEPVPQRLRAESLGELSQRLQVRYQDYWKAREVKEKLSLKRLEVKGALRSRSTSFEVNASNLKAAGRSSNLKPSRSRSQPSSLETSTQRYLASRSAIKLLVKEEGWYRVTQPELISAGLSSRVNPRNLQLYVEGKEQPIRVIGESDRRFDSGDAIEFYATGLDTLWTETRVYWLVEGTRAGKRIDTLISNSSIRNRQSAIGNSAGSFPYTVEKKDRGFYFSALLNGDESNFFGPMIYQAPLSQVLEVRNLDTGSGEALLEVSLMGATHTAHQVRVLVNEVEAGTLNWTGQSLKEGSFSLTSSSLLEGENLITLEPLGGELDVSLLDTIRLTYWHTYRADNDALRFTAQGGGRLTLSGFSHSAIRVFDITDVNEVIEVTGRVQRSSDGTYGVSLTVPESGERVLLALTEERIKQPAGILKDEPSSWSRRQYGYDLLMIAHEDFMGSLEPLKALRESEGLRAGIVNIEDLYDEYSFGAKSPRAIKDFLNHTRTYWSIVPRYVLLVGDASFDPRNYLGYGNQDYVPTRLIDATYLETASDDWFVDFDNDGVPEMAIGRLPVQTVQDATALVSKVVGYRSSENMELALLVSDQPDSRDYDFEEGTDHLEALFPDPIQVQKIYRGRYQTIGEARSVLLGLINQGPLLVNYMGHGSVGIWRGNLLTSADAETFTNAQRLPLFINMTCLNGFFQAPYAETLAEAILKAPEGGGVAVWTSSGLTEPDKQALMNREFLRLLFGQDSITLGEAAARAKASVSDQDVRRTWILFGDPSTKIK